MADYEMAFEEQVRLLVKKFGSLETRFGSFETRLDSIDSKLATVDGNITTLDGKVTSLDGKVTSLDGKVTSLDGKVTSLDAKVVALDGTVQKIRIELEQTHAVAKLGLEGIQGLRESTDKKFATLSKKFDDRFDVVESALVDVRKRVDKIAPIERPKTRRKRS